MKCKTELESFLAEVNKLTSIIYAKSILSWDAETGAPRSGAVARAESIGYLSSLYHDIITNEELNKNLYILEKNSDVLSDKHNKMVKSFIKEYKKLNTIPKDEMVAYNKLISHAKHSWEEAREKSDFSIFSKDLKKIITTLRKFAKYRDENNHPYNVFLDDYEEGMTIDKLEVFFEELKERIVPLLKKIIDSGVKIGNSFLTESYDVETQKQFGEVLLKDLGFDLDKGILSESTHPFTNGIDVDDVRLTSRYDENNFFTGILSVAHEGGHALYEQNIDRDLIGSTLDNGTSLGIHESQSRIYENNFCKSLAFTKFLLPKLKEIYPKQLDGVGVEEFYRAINSVQPSFIRVDADELTYPLHIMVRYEIEKALIEGEIEVDNLPEIWNKKMEEYLGIVPENDSIGVLQDVHWSFGLFGYFPTYALGSAYAAQIFNSLTKDMDINTALENGDMVKPLKWLTEKVHKFGSLLTPDEISLNATGELLNADYFCDYLEDKFLKIYNLK